MANQPVESPRNSDDSSDGFVSIRIVPLTVAIKPNEHHSVDVQVINESSIVEHYHVIVEGLSFDWLTLPLDEVRLMPNKDTSISFTIGPLPANTSTGTYPFRLTLRSKNDSRIEGHAFGMLQVLPAADFIIELSPSRIRNEGQAQLLLTNTGNIEQQFTVSGGDPDERVIVQATGQVDRVNVGEETRVTLNIAPAVRPFTGKTNILPFSVDVHPEHDTPRSVNGKLEVTPLIPRWLLAIVSLLLATVVGIGSCSINRMVNEVRQEATANAEAQVATVQAYNEQATKFYALEDADADGLAYQKEMDLGTDPFIKDSDEDGLNDGEEVNRGTNPTVNDTDGDTLLDGEEVKGNPNARGAANGQVTNPLKDDSDNDGLLDHTDTDSDKVEVIILDPQEILEDPSFEGPVLEWRNRADRSQIKSNVVLPVGWKLMLLDDVPAPENPDGNYYAFPEMKQIPITQMAECIGGRSEAICEIFVNQKAITIFKGGHPLRAAIYNDFPLEPGVYEFRIHYFADAYNKGEGAKAWAGEGAAQLQLCVEGGEYEHQNWINVPIGAVKEAVVRFSIPSATEVIIYVNLKNPLSLRNNGWFFDDWSLKMVEEYNDNTGRKPAEHGCEADMGAKLTN